MGSSNITSKCYPPDWLNPCALFSWLVPQPWELLPELNLVLWNAIYIKFRFISLGELLVSPTCSRTGKWALGFGSWGFAFDLIWAWSFGHLAMIWIVVSIAIWVTIWAAMNAPDVGRPCLTLCPNKHLVRHHHKAQCESYSASFD